MIALQFDSSLTAGVQAYLRAVERAAIEEATHKALTAIASKTRTRWARLIRADVQLPAAYFKRAMRRYPANAKRWSASVWSQTTPIPLRHFKPKQEARGVSVLIRKSRGRVLITSAFAGVMPNGREGVYLRKPGSRRGPGARAGARRRVKTGRNVGKFYRPQLPIEEQKLNGGLRALAEGTKPQAIAIAQGLAAPEFAKARHRALQRNGLAA